LKSPRCELYQTPSTFRRNNALSGARGHELP
jgi:hypothetical protein